MNPKLETLFISVLVIILAAIGAWVSTKIRDNQLGVWSYFLIGNLTLASWCYVSKYSKMQLMFASFLFDVLVAITWALVLFFMGDKLTVMQMAGSFVMVVGLVVFSL